MAAAVQEHPSATATEMLPTSAPGPCARLAGARVKMQSVACVIASVLVPIKIEPFLAEADVLGATAYSTTPFPSPLFPDVTVIQLALAAAVQGQPAGALTVTVPLSAPAPCERDAWERLYVQRVDCAMLNEFPAGLTS